MLNENEYIHANIYDSRAGSYYEIGLEEVRYCYYCGKHMHRVERPNLYFNTKTGDRLGNQVYWECPSFMGKHAQYYISRRKNGRS